MFITGHFLLTNLLLDIMKNTASRGKVEGRIVNVSSLGHMFAYREGIRLNDINLQSRWHISSAQQAWICIIYLFLVRPMAVYWNIKYPWPDHMLCSSIMRLWFVIVPFYLAYYVLLNLVAFPSGNYSFVNYGLFSWNMFSKPLNMVKLCSYPL